MTIPPSASKVNRKSARKRHHRGLAKRGFLPRYAFPLDVVSLETSLNRWSTDSDVTLSRDRALAIAEFAPGSQVIARKRFSPVRDFTSPDAKTIRKNFATSNARTALKLKPRNCRRN
jgi:hypothetical protein